MDIQKENSLSIQLAVAANIFAEMFGRIVTDDLTGDSKIMAFKDMLFSVSNTDGLQALLDGKIPRVTDEANHLVMSNNAGGLDLAGLDTYTFETEAQMNAITGNGFYMHTGATLTLPFYGSVGHLFVGGGYRLVFASNGVWYASYSSGWSIPRYVGGAFDNITITYAEAVAMTTAEPPQLSPGASYKITGIGQDEGIILRAASANTFETDGIRLGLVPIGVFSGIWATDMTLPTQDEFYYYCGRIWQSKTGAKGTASGWALDAVNWLLMDPATTVGTYYQRHIFGCSYKLVSTLPLTYPTGFVTKQWDVYGNELGDLVEYVDEYETPDGFKVEYNDWYHNDEATIYFGNKVRRLYNNSIQAGFRLSNNQGNGDIYDCLLCNINECVLPDQNNNIRHTRGTRIYKNVLGGLADIQYLADGSDLQNNTVNGDIKGDVSVFCTASVSNSVIYASGEIKDCISVNIVSSEIHGTIDGNKTNSVVNMEGCYVGIDFGSPIITNNATLIMTRSNILDGASISTNVGTTTITDSIINQRASIQGNTEATIERSVMLFGSALTGTTMNDYAKLFNSTLSGANNFGTIAANVTIQQSQSKITGSFYIGTGTFTIPTGATYNPLTVVTGCVGTKIRENGVTVDATSDRVLVAKYAGWYRFKYTSSVLCQTINTIMEAIIYVNSSPLQAGYNSKTYTAVDSYINASLSTDLLLAVGDVVSVKYKHNKGGTVTFSLGQVNHELEYNN